MKANKILIFGFLSLSMFWACKSTMKMDSQILKQDDEGLSTTDVSYPSGDSKFWKSPGAVCVINPDVITSAVIPRNFTYKQGNAPICIVSLSNVAAPIEDETKLSEISTIKNWSTANINQIGDYQLFQKLTSFDVSYNGNIGTLRGSFVQGRGQAGDVTIKIKPVCRDSCTEGDLDYDMYRFLILDARNEHCLRVGASYMFWQADINDCSVFSVLRSFRSYKDTYDYSKSPSELISSEEQWYTQEDYIHTPKIEAPDFGTRVSADNLPGKFITKKDQTPIFLKFVGKDGRILCRTYEGGNSDESDKDMHIIDETKWDTDTNSIRCQWVIVQSESGNEVSISQPIQDRNGNWTVAGNFLKPTSASYRGPNNILRIASGMSTKGWCYSSHYACTVYKIGFYSKNPGGGEYYFGESNSCKTGDYRSTRMSDKCAYFTIIDANEK